MKKVMLFLTILMVGMSFTSNAQDRVNRPKLSFEQSSETLTNSTGWAYNDELGEWVDYDKIICKSKSYKTTSESLKGSDYMKSNYQSFNSIQIKTLTFNNLKYYVLIVHNIHGRYKYPTIHQDWRYYKFVETYIFNETEYGNLKKYNEAKIDYVVNYDLEYEQFNETTLLDKIQTALSAKAYDDYILPLYESKDENVRFLLPKSKSHIKGEKIGSYYFEPIYDFKKIYFETSKIEFNKLLIL